MPQLKTAKKELRKTQRRRTINDTWRNKLRSAVKEIRLALAAKDYEKASTAYQKTQKILDRTARRNIIHPRTAARKKSRMMRAITRAKTSAQ